MPANSAWKRHEQSVAEFFLTSRNYDHLTHASLTGDDASSDVIVSVKDWLSGIGKNVTGSKEPWDHLIVECKYRKSTSLETHWLKEFFAFYDGISTTVEKHKRRPLMLLPDGWMIFRLGNFPDVYRAIFASNAPDFRVWLGQFTKSFFIQHVAASAPGYFDEWLESTKDIDKKKYGEVLPLICLGSSTKKHGPGGGKIVIMNMKV